MTEKDIQRFWSKVNKDGPIQEHVPHLGKCWVWTGGKYSNGYGQIYWKSTGNKRDSAHKISWTIHNGPVERPMCVCHKCDNRACVNPNHLFLGTSRDNLRDMANKGRWNNCAKSHPERIAKGERVGTSVLKEVEAKEIFSLKGGDEYGKDIAVRYGVSSGTVYAIWKRKIWKHI